MYIEKLKFLQETYVEDNCIAGITTSAFDDMSVGTPCIAVIQPFTIYDGIGNRSSLDSPWSTSFSLPSSAPGLSRLDHGRPRAENIGEPRAENIGEPRDRNVYDRGAGIKEYHVSKVIKSKPAPEKPEITEAKKTTAKDIYQIAKKDLSKANDILSRSLDQMNVIIPFSIWSDTADYVVHPTNTRRFHIDGSLPIIFDNGTYTEINRLSDVYSNSDISNFPDLLVEKLRNNRFVNYTFLGVSVSNLKYMLEDINSFYNVLTKAYPNHISFFQYPCDRVKVITDIVSVSFYELGDVLPIFDYKRASGICMEVFITNSLIKGQDIISKMKSATYRFVFSKSKENVFTIDGEAICRPHDMSSSKVISMVRDRIAKVGL
jgi:hypothetical protein